MSETSASDVSGRSSLTGIIKWVGGIAGAVITALLIQHFAVSPTTAPPKPPVTPLALYGLVTNAATGMPIRNADVSIVVQGLSADQATDDGGQYHFDLSALNPGEYPGSITVKASGYETSQQTLELRPDQPFAGFRLVSIAVPAAPAGMAGEVHPTTAAVKPPITYVRPEQFTLRAPAARLMRK